MNISIVIFSAFLAVTAPKTGNFAAGTTSPESAAIGDLFSRVTRLEEQNRKLEGTTEELEHKINLLEKENAELKKAAEQKKLAPPAAVTPAPKTTAEDPKIEIKSDNTEPKIIINKNEPTPPAPPVIAEKKPETSSSPNKDFETAFALMAEQKIDESRAAFEKFTKKYPNSSLSGEAFYWLGEMDFDAKDYNNAAINYLKGYRDYPKGTKAAENILKLALTLQELGKTSEACQNLARFKTEFKNAHLNLRTKAANKSKELACK